MTTIPDHYAALGIDPTADPEVITAAYRALAKKFHPDTGAAAGTASPERFDDIQKAYEVLRTPESRHAYDLELLAATEAELEQHLASKRRVAVRERVREAEAEQAAAAAAPDLGDIRPEPAVPPRPAARRTMARRSFMPVMIPLLLMALLGGGAAWLFLPPGPVDPALPAAERQQAAVTRPQAPTASAPTTEAPVKPVAPAQTVPAAADQPVFGSTATDAAPPVVEEAAATPDAIPAPDAASGSTAASIANSAANSGANSAAKSDKPVFGSSGAIDAAAAAATPPAATQQAAPPPPVPKSRPAQPNRQAAQQKPAAKTVQKQTPVQQQAQLQPRARLQYQDPPQYYPQPDGYPPPGYPTPGYEPPGYEPDYPPPGYGGGDVPPPPGFRPPGGGPYRLVIFERQPGRQATAWSAGVVFKSIGKCTRQGVKAVLRRSATDPYSDGTRVWYECQQLTQR